ncbi:Phosphate ABC transporter, permease protein PstA [Bombilactobacillus mellis]|uniref:Phosphate transport system permease protein PstA n=1 Tax=Bombilactobacillus mellis TaxID=1218508 RepID=A0A0F4KQT4_9LACO|nr:Phosphate ABC transporter, permease protein PstA [Bombilactobacillus mellis]NUF98541.1 phosphate ABC transporter permease PstA [Bombilactobacillus mellis]NUG38381.1 phosphate ABC transporter permease PstA [Bombilactobacillus mellis]NUG66355.1 phosphate ABC transporter permease PstA [Bombilactobacillus mellis]
MKAKKIDRLMTGVIYLMSAIIVAILIALLIYIFGAGLPHINWHFLTGAAQSFRAGGGIGTQLFNSLYLLILSMLVSIPLAIGIAIYLSEYTVNQKLTNLISSAIEVLSSLPSIVVGLFGFLIFVVHFHFSFSILSGALTLTIFNLPLLVRSITDALQTVSLNQREAGLALGLSRWETVIHVIIPECLPAIITGIILAAGRVFGEAAALIYTAGQSAPPLDFTNWNVLSLSSPLNFMRPAETLAVHIWKVNSEGLIPDASAVSAGSSLVLVIVVLLFNLAARYLGGKLYKHLTGE